jgi:hypothetical protein
MTFSVLNKYLLTFLNFMKHGKARDRLNTTLVTSVVPSPTSLPLRLFTVKFDILLAAGNHIKAN